MTQDAEVSLVDFFRQRRRVFLENENKFVLASEFNEEVLHKYARQIRSAFPNAEKRIQAILEQDEIIRDDKKEK